MILNSRPYIVGEVGIDCCSRFGGQQRDALRDGAAWRERSMDHGDRFLAVLDYDLRTGADPGQQPSEVAGRLRFRDVDHMVSHEVIIAVSGYENGWQHRSHPFAKDAKGWGTRRKNDPAKAAEIESWLTVTEGTFPVIPMDSACFREWARLKAG